MTLLLLFNQTPYHETLLDLAQKLHDEGEYALAVVTAQMACESTGEEVVSALLSAHVAPLEPSISELVPSHHLGHDKVRALFDALTGAKLANEQWWPDYKDHIKLRNDVMHRNVGVDQVASSRSLRVADAFCTHVLALAPST